MDELLPTTSVDCSRFKQRRQISELSQEQTRQLLIRLTEALEAVQRDLEGPELPARWIFPHSDDTCFLISYAESTLNLHKGLNHISQLNRLRTSPSLRLKMISLGPISPPPSSVRRDVLRCYVHCTCHSPRPWIEIYLTWMIYPCLNSRSRLNKTGPPDGATTSLNPISTTEK